MTGAIVNLICHLTVSHCVDSRRIPPTLVVGVCQEQNKSLMSPTHSLNCGKVFTIKNIVKSSRDDKERYIFDDDNIWTKGLYWKDCMIEEKILK